MRFNIVLLLGLVSATYALPNPGLRHFQPRSDSEAEADDQPAVENHTSGLLPRADSAAHTSADSAESRVGVTQPYFLTDPKLGPQYTILPSSDPTGAIARTMRAYPRYAFNFASWSCRVISRIFNPHFVFVHTDTRAPQAVHEPHEWYWQITNTHMAVVIDKNAAQVVGWIHAADARSIHNEKWTVILIPAIGKISVSGEADQVKVRGAFCNSNREEFPGTSFSIPESPHYPGDDRPIIENYRRFPTPSTSVPTHS
ncbi:hypothetical protein F5878DRAFT_8726 [Lentinula raphanica]|uniref:Uncharacterized protein n=1 Tax=Lentinula raphanica TaxID=153919 RepID=A0AA38NXH0_9AGAR|nr:hypothetical protein F5878DRAFT_8726 [Lentinula raphanica]